ncbi:MAG: TetR/AcrR family transcriptional regulator [Limnochordia bacterium]
MDTSSREEARIRILDAATELFSEKGYDATRVNEIAKLADVNKALIYYYFESKEDILDHLIASIMGKVSAISLEFVDDAIVSMIEEGRLDLEEDRFWFLDEAAMQYFEAHVNKHHIRLVDYVVENRSVIRILLFESLKGGEHQNALFRFTELMDKRRENPLYSTIWDADQDFNYHEDTVFFKFFFSLIPLVSMAAYYDDYKAKNLLNDENMKELALQSFRILFDVAKKRYIYTAGDKIN